MSRLARQAAVLTVARIINYGLMLISPLVLVRVLPIVDVGRYREYLVYVTLLVGFGTFSIYDSMLYFVPAHPTQHWRIVRHTIVMVAVSSFTVVLLTVSGDLISHGRLIGPFLLPLSIYVLLHVNIDFWEWFWISNHRPVPVMWYTSGRLTARMLVVVTAAILTHDVGVIIWSLIALELLRFGGSLYAWRRHAGHSDGIRNTPLLREQIHFSLASGLSVLLTTLSRNAGNLAVIKVLGPVAMALYSTGLYGEPVIAAVRNSISAILLPELVRLSLHDKIQAVRLWRKATVINCMMLFPVAMLLVHFATPLVAMVFGPAYVGAAPVLQLYSIIILRECFDLTLPLRAVKRMAPLLRSSLVGLTVNVVALSLLLRVLGLRGAVLAVAAASIAEAGYQAWSVNRLPGFGLRVLFPWRGVLKVMAAAVLPLLIFLVKWPRENGFIGIASGSLAYLLLYGVLLWALRLEELSLVRSWLERRRHAEVPGA